jgi:hypothetical protein
MANWERDANNTSIYYVTEDDAMEYEEDEDTGNPSFCKELDVEPFLEFQTFNDIVDKSKDNDVDSVIEAINYYRKYDTFQG